MLYNPFHHSTPATKYAVFDLRQYQSSDNAGVQTSSPTAEDKKNDCKNFASEHKIWEVACLISDYLSLSLCLCVCLFVCVEVLRPSQPNGVMSSAVSLPNHTFTGQA